MRPDIEIAVRAVAPKFGLGFPYAAAVIDVESGGAPFEPSGLPRFLFERHQFYARLPAAKRAQAVSLGLANREWRPKIQYRDQRTPEGRAALLDRAVRFGGAEVAYRSASWGLMQIMGFNYILADASSAVDLVAKCKTIEGQLIAAFNFIQHEKLLLPLKRKQWAVFAEGYNGAGFRKNAYDVKLARAYAKFGGR